MELAGCLAAESEELRRIDRTVEGEFESINHQLGRLAVILENDLWIAAVVRQYGLPLLSNDAHFDHVGGVIRIGWR
jgi:predicted nucleic acid-binding protein